MSVQGRQPHAFFKDLSFSFMKTYYFDEVLVLFDSFFLHSCPSTLLFAVSLTTHSEPWLLENQTSLKSESAP